MDICGHRTNLSRMKSSRSLGRILHWLPSFAAGSSPPEIQRRTVFSETQQIRAVSGISIRGSGRRSRVAGISGHLWMRGRSWASRGFELLARGLACQKANKGEQGTRCTLFDLNVLLCFALSHLGHSRPIDRNRKPDRELARQPVIGPSMSSGSWTSGITSWVCGA